MMLMIKDRNDNPRMELQCLYKMRLLFLRYKYGKMLNSMCQVRSSEINFLDRKQQE